MRIKSNTAIATIATTAADELGIKPSRAGWQVRAQQAERFARLLEQEERPSTRKAKAGVQGITGRTRVERKAVEVEAEVAVENRPRSWGVVCQNQQGFVYVTTAVVEDDVIDIDTVATMAGTDRVIGTTNWINDTRFPLIKSMCGGNADHPHFIGEIGEVLGYSSDYYLVWYVPAK